MLSQVLVIVLAVLNAAVLIWSGETWGWDIGPWLRGFPLALALLIITVACFSKSVFIANLSLPLLVYFGWELFNRSGGEISLLLHDISLVLAGLDLLYVLGVNFRYRYWKELFWGLLAGLLVLFAFHKAVFGGISIEGNIMKLYDNSVEWLDRKVK